MVLLSLYILTGDNKLIVTQLNFEFQEYLVKMSLPGGMVSEFLSICLAYSGEFSSTVCTWDGFLVFS